MRPVRRPKFENPGKGYGKGNGKGDTGSDEDSTEPEEAEDQEEDQEEEVEEDEDGKQHLISLRIPFLNQPYVRSTCIRN